MSLQVLLSKQRSLPSSPSAGWAPPADRWGAALRSAASPAAAADLIGDAASPSRVEARFLPGKGQDPSIFSNTIREYIILVLIIYTMGL